MPDRASNNNIKLDILKMDEKRKLKCTANIVLSIYDASENVFKFFGEKVGREILAVEKMGCKLLHGTRSIIMLGFIVQSKCCRLSQATLGYSHDADLV